MRIENVDAITFAQRLCEPQLEWLGCGERVRIDQMFEQAVAQTDAQYRGRLHRLESALEVLAVNCGIE